MKRAGQQIVVSIQFVLNFFFVYNTLRPHHFLHLWWDVPRYLDNYSFSYLAGRRVPYLLLLGLALPRLVLTAVRLARRTRATLHNAMPEVLALTLIGTYTLVYSLFGAFHSRYRLPIELGLLIFAGTMMRPVANRAWQWWVPSATVSSLKERRLENVRGPF